MLCIASMEDLKTNSRQKHGFPWNFQQRCFKLEIYTQEYQVSDSNIMAEGGPQRTQPCQEGGHGQADNGVSMQQHGRATSLRALKFQTENIIQQATEFLTELGRMEQEDLRRLLSRAFQLHQSTGDMLLDVGACSGLQNMTHPRPHATNRGGVPAHQNPTAAHNNLTATTDNSSRAAPLRDQDLGATGGTGEFIDIREGNEGPSESTSEGGATTNMAPIASPSVRIPAPGDILFASDHDIQDATAPPTAHPTPEDILVTPDGQDATEPPAVGPTLPPEDILNTPENQGATQPPAVCPTSAPEESHVTPDIQGATQPPAEGPTLPPEDILNTPDIQDATEAPAPKANPPSKPLSSSSEPMQPPSSSQPPPPQPTVYPLLLNDYIPRRQEAEPQPQSWVCFTNSDRAPSSAHQLDFMPPGTMVPDSGPKAFIHLEGEHYPRLQAEEPD